MAISRLSQNTLQNAFSKYNNIWDGRSAVGSVEAISSITLSASQSRIEFNSIPSTYSHLELRMFVRGSSTTGSVRLTFNNDTSGGAYSRHVLYGNGTSALASGASGDSVTAVLGDCSVSSNTSGIFSPFVAQVLDYASTSKRKTIKCLSGYDANGSGFIELRS